MKIAVEGCCHGELDKIYETLKFIEDEEGIKVDILLICGDFQAVRNKGDLTAMAVPPKYYSGEAKAPVLTIFIGGNHEASNYLQELPYGGWVAPNIYYLGYAGVLNFGGIRIGGISGIYKGKDFMKGHHEHLPYNNDTKRSVYHVRNLEVFRLKQLKKPVDIMLSHDWPRGVYYHGNTNALLRKKSFFRAEVENNTLGSPACEDLLHHMRPKYWFSAHLHVKFAAQIEHQPADESSLLQNDLTKFLALDKCLPRRAFLQVIDFPHDTEQPPQLELDPEWLCVLKNTNHLFSTQSYPCYMPGPGGGERFDFAPTEEELRMLKEDFDDTWVVPENFVQTAPVHNPLDKRWARPETHINPQTTLLCEMLDLLDPNQKFAAPATNTSTTVNKSANPDEIDLGDDDDDDDVKQETVTAAQVATTNPDEIDIDDDVGTNPEEVSLSPDDGEDHLEYSTFIEDTVLLPNTPSDTGSASKTESPGVLSLPPPRAPSFNESPTEKLSLLKLPPPINSGDISTNIATTLDDEAEISPKRSLAESTPLREPKRLKRRNQSIYETNEEDS